MSSAVDRAIQAIRDIVGIKPEAIELLNAIGKRGVLEGVEVFADIAAEEDCCNQDEGDRTPPDGPCDTQPGTIWCNPDDAWKDCQTGQPVTIGAGGFPQAESCKECGPDDSWVDGGYVTYNSTNYVTPAEAGAVAAVGFENSLNNAATTRNASCSYLRATFRVGAMTIYCACTYEARRGIPGYYYWETTTSEPGVNVTGKSCDANYIEAMCPDVAPDICGDDWESDGTTDLAVINGCITGSSCDPDATSADEKCKQCQDLCNDAGQTMRVCATPDGGFVAYDPSGELKGGKYSSDGTRTEQYDAGDSGGWV